MTHPTIADVLEKANQPWSPTLMLYHANCADGFGAAWAARQRWPGLRCLPVSYGQLPPEVHGHRVLIGDFSFKRDVLDMMLQTAESIVILDHHKTAEADLAPFAVTMCGSSRLCPEEVPGMLRDLDELDRPPCIALFDMERSGARMVWDFCFDHEPPTMIDLIEDRDLWRFRREETKPFGLRLRAEPFDFDRWDLIAQELDTGFDGQKIMDEAHAMQRFYDQKVSELVGMATMRPIGGFEVPTVNCPPSFASDIGNALLVKYPDAPFSACWSMQGDKFGYSLRSEDGRLDVSQIATQYGGGGHRNAAGFGTTNILLREAAALAKSGAA